MILIHKDEMHFNLVVKKNSKLATQGSLSFRHNIGPIMTNNVKKETQSEVCEKKDNTKEPEDNEEFDNLIDLRKELQACKERNLKL